jgi:proline iminopeptidase
MLKTTSGIKNANSKISLHQAYKRIKPPSDKVRIFLVARYLPFLLLLASCSRTKGNSVNYEKYFSTDGTTQAGGVKMIPIKTAKGDFNVWTKTVGFNPKIKVLLLNGGPGASHDYLECFENFFPKEGIEFIYYDQLGTGNSEMPSDTSVYDLDRSVEEVEQVRKALYLNAENFYLYGHSWGGVVALEYALKYQKHLKSLIISNMMSSASAFNTFADTAIMRKIEPRALSEIRQEEFKGNYESPRYMMLLMPFFYEKYFCRLANWPEPLMRSYGKVNREFYVSMHGPSEFRLSGKLKYWERKKDLPQITVPTLTIGARYDTMDPKHMKWMATQVKNGSYLYCPNGSHMCFYDDQSVYFDGLTKYIEEIAAGQQTVNF